MLQVRAPFVIRPVSRPDVVVTALLQELQGGWYQWVSGGEAGRWLRGECEPFMEQVVPIHVRPARQSCYSTLATKLSGLDAC
jgi:hypothetical protein